jgi:hypothetical protein
MLVAGVPTFARQPRAWPQQRSTQRDGDEDRCPPAEKPDGIDDDQPRGVAFRLLGSGSRRLPQFRFSREREASSDAMPAQNIPLSFFDSAGIG